LKDEVRLFFIEHKSFSLSERVNDYSWLATLAYQSDIFTYLNALNLSLQGTHVTIFKVEDEIEAMIKSWICGVFSCQRRITIHFQISKILLKQLKKNGQIKILNISYSIWVICNGASVITFLFQIKWKLDSTTF